jgi:hypothetical protein
MSGLDATLRTARTDADARNDPPNAAGEPRTIVEEQVLRQDTEIDP